MRVAPLLFATTLLAAADPSCPGGVPWWGYRGPGGTAIVDGKPPVSADLATGTNVAWTTAMPNWGYSLPVICQERVFVVSEGGWPAEQDFPLLQILDAATGTETARLTLDHLPHTSLPPADQEAARKAWATVMADFRTNYQIFHRYITGDEAAKQATVAEWKALGRAYGGWKGGGYGQLRSLKPKCDQAAAKLAATAGLTQATWQHGCGMGLSCFGQTFPSPVSDGEAVYIATAFGSFFAVDPTGKLRWGAYLPGKPGEYCRNGRSPLIHGDLLISDAGAVVRGIDRGTGELRWSHPVDEETWMSPLVITVGGKDVLLCFNRRAFLLPQGTPLNVAYTGDFGAGGSIVKHDERDVAFFTGGGEHGGWANKGTAPIMPPSAVRFRLDGDTLQGEVLWSGIDGAPLREHIGLLYHGGVLYHTGTGSGYEALTGKRVLGSGDRKKSVLPPTKHLLFLADDRIYGLAVAGGKEGSPGQNATLACCDLAGKKLGETVFACAKPEGIKATQIIEQNGWPTWGFSYAGTFTISGDRILVRSVDNLWCLKAK